MFYAQEVLSKKGPLGKVWIAAHMERKLTKAQVIQTSIPDSADLIMQPKEQLALRLSGHLLLGLSRIYSRKVGYLLTDCSDALVKIKMAFRPGQVDLPPTATVANVGAITIPDITEDVLRDDELFVPMLVEPRTLEPTTVSRPQDITLPEEEEEPNLGDHPLPIPPMGDIDMPDIDMVPEPDILRREQTPLHDLPPLVDDPMADLPPLPDDPLPMQDFPVTPTKEQQPHEITPLAATPITPTAGIEIAPISLTPVVSPAPSAAIRVRRENRKRRAVDAGGNVEISAEQMRRQIENCEDLIAPRQYAPLTYDEFTAERHQSEYGNDLVFLRPALPSIGLGLEQAIAKRLKRSLERAVARDVARIEQREVEATQQEEEEEEPEEIEKAREEGVAAPPSPLPLPDIDPIEAPVDPLIPEEIPLPTEPLDALPEEQPVDLPPLSPMGDIQFPAASQAIDASHSSWTGRTRKMIAFLDEQMGSRDSLSFTKLCDRKSKRVVAGAFFEVLVLKSRGVVDVAQRGPFGDITVRKTDRFAEMAETPSSPQSIASDRSTPLSFLSLSQSRSDTPNKRSRSRSLSISSQTSDRPIPAM